MENNWKDILNWIAVRNDTNKIWNIITVSDNPVPNVVQDVGFVLSVFFPSCSHIVPNLNGYIIEVKNLIRVTVEWEVCTLRNGIGFKNRPCITGNNRGRNRIIQKVRLTVGSSVSRVVDDNHLIKTIVHHNNGIVPNYTSFCISNYHSQLYKTSIDTENGILIWIRVFWNIFRMDNIRLYRILVDIVRDGIIDSRIYFNKDYRFRVL